MQKKILRYQKAFNSVADKLSKTNEVLAVMAFGSVLTGDLWEGSDIDLVAIANDEIGKRKNIYLTENNITVHMRVIKKKEFLEFNKKNLRGGKLHRILISSRLIFCKDSEITNTFNSFKYYPEKDKERWNLVYLSSVLKDIEVCKKYIQNKRIYTAYENVINIVKDFSMLFLNFNGYLVSKDATTLSIDMNDEFKNKVDNVLYNSKENCEKSILELIEYVEGYINSNLKLISTILLKFLKNSEKHFSAEEIAEHELFEEFSIGFPEVLELLYKNNLIKKGEDIVFSIDDENTIKENVYGNLM